MQYCNPSNSIKVNTQVLAHILELFDVKLCDCKNLFLFYQLQSLMYDSNCWLNFFWELLQICRHECNDLSRPNFNFSKKFKKLWLPQFTHFKKKKGYLKLSKKLKY